MKIKELSEAVARKFLYYLRADRTNVCSFDRDKNLNLIEARIFYNRGILWDFNTLKFGTLML